MMAMMGFSIDSVLLVKSDCKFSTFFWICNIVFNLTFQSKIFRGIIPRRWIPIRGTINIGRGPLQALRIGGGGGRGEGVRISPPLWLPSERGVSMDYVDFCPSHHDFENIDSRGGRGAGARGPPLLRGPRAHVPVLVLRSPAGHPPGGGGTIFLDFFCCIFDQLNIVCISEVTMEWRVFHRLDHPRPGRM